MIYRHERKLPLRCRSPYRDATVLHKHTFLHIHIKNSLLHTLNISTHIYITHANTRHTRVKVLYRDATSMCGEDRCFIEMLYNVRYRLVIGMPHKEGIVQL